MNDVRAAVTTALRNESIVPNLVGNAANLAQYSIGTEVTFGKLFRESSTSDRRPYSDSYARFQDGTPVAEVSRVITVSCS